MSLEADKNSPCATIRRMGQLAYLGVHLLEALFFLGLLGSLAVVLLSSVGDMRDLLFRKDDPL